MLTSVPLATLITRLRDGSPAVLGALFSGLISSYQACDPAVADGSSRNGSALPLDELHAILDGAFARPER